MVLVIGTWYWCTKDFLKRELGVSLNKGDGPSCTTLFNKMELTVNKNRTKINGVKYNGIKVIILKNGKMEYSINKGHESTTNEFKELIRKAK